MDGEKEDFLNNELVRQLARLEARVHRLEEMRGVPAERAVAELEQVPAPAGEPVFATEKVGARDALEFEVGQNWFAKVGILVLAAGAGFAISLPYDGLPAALPSAVGYVLVGLLFLMVRFWRDSFDTLARYLRRAAVVLFYFATLRLYFFGKEPVLSADTVLGAGVLVVVALLCFAIALHRRSPYLASLALLTGFATAVIVPGAWFTLFALAALAAMAATMRIRHNWPWVLLLGIVSTYATHVVWMLNRPIMGNPVQWVREPAVSICFILAYAGLLGAGSFLRRDNDKEDALTIASAFLNAGLAFLVFFAGTEAMLKTGLAPAYALAALVFLALATVFWLREHSRVSTFVYAMTGYLALSVAIIKVSVVPNVFVWLSLQSLLVVATAVWFQSRFIVVANFAIYLATVAGYLVLAKEEGGMSILFGVVALLSARILNWRRERLQLKTETMRNAYLLCVLVAFPYALYHLVPANFVSLAWVAVALFYYLMNMIVSVRKYRWMGHATLLGTVFYVLIIGIIRLNPAYRILSFFVLGTVLVIVSLVFARLRAKNSTGEKSDIPGDASKDVMS